MARAFRNAPGDGASAGGGALLMAKKITDKERIAFMLKIEAIGGQWYDPLYQTWPDIWAGDVMRLVVDFAMNAEVKKL